jgi:ectoine hydroxylase-related dioxygenase (phytanoyl-CoA dioxygenase family)
MDSGFLRIERFIDPASINELGRVLTKFHKAWLKKNESYFREGAVNSSNLTSGEFLSSTERLQILKFVASHKVVKAARSFLGPDIRYLNTQIFFNPLNPEQENYWHRDIQYTGQPLKEQQQTIEEKKPKVLHVRLALSDEPGIELIPGSHFRWDIGDELDVRLSRNGRFEFEDLPGSEKISLKKGNLLLFDANIIHRGLYGKDRFAFDILFFTPDKNIQKLVTLNTLPKNEELKDLDCPEVFSQI